MKLFRFYWVLLAVAGLLALTHCGTKTIPLDEARRAAPPTAQREVSLGAAEPFKESPTGFSVAKRAMFGFVSREGALTATTARSLRSLRFAPAVLTRNGAARQTSTQATIRDHNVVRSFGNVHEKIESRPGELEISWTFDTRPEGDGELSIELPVDSRGGAVVSRDGLRFAEEQMRVSHASWIDATGARVDIPAHFEHGSVRYVIPEQTLRSARYPAVLDPTISPERALDPTSITGAPTQVGAGADYFYGMAAAFGGTDYLFIWIDQRESTARILATRISETGAILDPAGLLLVEVGGDSALEGVSVAHAPNGGYLVVYVSRRLGGYQGTRSTFGLRIKDDGTPLGQPIALGEVPWPVLSATDTSFVMFTGEWWTDSPWTLDATFISGAGQPMSVREVPAILSLRGRLRSAPIREGDGVSLLFGESLAGVPYSSFKRATFRNDKLESLATIDTVSDDHNYYQSATAGRIGDTYFFPMHRQSATSLLVYLYRANDLAKAGELQLAEFTEVHYMYTDDASVTFSGYGTDGITKRCTYSPTFQLQGACIAEEQRNNEDMAPVVGATTTLLPVSVEGSAVRGPQPGVHIVRRSDGASVFGPAPVARVVNAQLAPTAAFDTSASEFLTVWTDDRHGDEPSSAAAGIQLLGTRISEHGSVLDDVFDISPSGNRSQSAPHVTPVGPSQYFVTWVELTSAGDTARIVGVNVQTKPTRSVSPTIELARSTYDRDHGLGGPLAAPTATFDGSGLIVAWVERDAVRAKRLPARPVQADVDGAPTTTLSAIGDRRSRAALVSVFDGKRSLFVWTEAVLVGSELYGVTLAAGAASPDGAPFPLATAFGSKQSPSLATDGKTGSLLVWQDTSVADGHGIYAKFLPRENMGSLDPSSQFAISQNAWDESSPTVAFANDGESYFVAWSDRRDPARAAIYGNWVTLDGRVLSPTKSGERISDATEGSEDVPFATAGPESTIGLVYTRYDGAPMRGSPRARFRTIRSGNPNGRACATALDCASRECVDGVCCNSSCSEGCGTCAGTSEGAVVGICSPMIAKSTCGDRNRSYCDGVSLACKTTCESNDDCAFPSECVEGRCLERPPVCSSETQVTAAGSATVSCGNYRCRAGACLERCESIDDCAPDLVCTFENRCAAPAAPTNADACAFSIHPVGRPNWVALVGVLGLAARSRRRAAPQRKHQA